MRPILHALYVPVLDRIDVDVIDVVLQIALGANDVFVKATLPNPAFASSASAGREQFIFRHDSL